jgi:hypothetical protein
LGIPINHFLNIKNGATGLNNCLAGVASACLAMAWRAPHAQAGKED